MNRTGIFIRRATSIAALAAIAALALALPASSYEQRRRGDLRFVAGWGDPPAFAGEPNSLQIVLADRGGPVSGGVNLSVEIAHGDAAATVRMQPHFDPGVWGQTGDYRAFFVPSEPGTYTFRIHGTVKGRPFDETFQTGKSFTDVLDRGTYTFPATTEPTPDSSPDADRGSRLERLEQEVAKLKASAVALEEAARESLDAADGARSTATAGLIVGLLAMLGGLTVAGMFLWRRR